ncbi:MAG: hypothetical protein J6M39_03865 [Lachnospiraceae bacterium]|nr:hypothetical protein [Lachnospiraceae bacterium]
MRIIKNNELSLNKNILLYKYLNDKDEEIGKIRIGFYESDKINKNNKNSNNEYAWYVWEAITCNNLNNYLNLVSNEKMKELFRQDMKEHMKNQDINYCEGDKVRVVVYPISDNDEILKAMASDLMQQYSILTLNNKTKVIDIYDLYL